MWKNAKRRALRIGALLGVIAGVVALNGCGSMKLSDFENTTPTLRLEDYFAGGSRAWGVFEDRFGTVKRQFTVDINGDWDGEKLVLTEDFVYDDGETETRIWTIRPDGPSTYVGSADGVVGEARGAVAGQALNWTYEFDLKLKDSTIRVTFDDWMWLQPDGVLINRAIVKKFGFEVGRATIFFKKVAEEAVADVALREAAE